MSKTNDSFCFSFFYIFFPNGREKQSKQKYIVRIFVTLLTIFSNLRKKKNNEMDNLYAPKNISSHWDRAERHDF